MNKKYASKKHTSACVKRGECIYKTTTWRRMLEVKDEAEKCIQWVVGSGGMSF